MRPPDLDRMAVDDIATSPERIATEIHRQLGSIPPPIPVRDIALALGIDCIREVPLTSFEGVLITDPERSAGGIMINSASRPYRRRYSIAHELGHFLCAWHERRQTPLFACTRGDMGRWTGEDEHQRQEAEANRFALELLAPARLMASCLKKLPDLEHVLDLSPKLEVSKEAIARRYASLHSQCVAAIFCRDGRFS